MKIVCYTALIGDYDKLRPPRFVSKDWDYVCFTDQPIKKCGVWQIRPLQKEIAGDPTRTNRWHKMHPHLLFPDYDASIYLDTNVQITGPHLESRVREFTDNQTLIALPPHPKRTCVYEEIEKCIFYKVDDQEKLQSIKQHLREEKFPPEQGLFENNLIFRRHNDPKIIQLNNLWWDFLNKHARRDQLSLTYLLWKSGITPEPIVPFGNTIRHFKGYKYRRHKGRKKIDAPYIITGLIPVKNWRRNARAFLRSLSDRNCKKLQKKQP